MASDSTIGPGTFIRGSVRGEGDLEIHGRIEGSVAVSGELLIAETALIRSDVTARRAVVRGAVLGNISADEAIVLEAGARVVGDLVAPQVGIRPGGLLRGSVSTEGPLSSAAITAEPATMARARTSPRAASVVVAPLGKAAPPAQAARAPLTRPLPPVRPPPRPVAAPHTTSAEARPAPAPAPAPPVRVAATQPSMARPVLPSPPRAAEPAPAAAAAMHSEPAEAAPHPAVITAHEEEPTGLSEPDGLGGPPPPVVPALRKGAKASLKRKGAR